MTSIHDIVHRYAAEAGKPGARMLHSKRSSVFVGGNYGGDDTTIYSWGHHFPMAVIRPDEDGPRGWWLVNGDRSTHSTSRHQSDLRSALERTGLPMLIVPFDALHRAAIVQDSVTPVEILPDRYTWDTHYTDEEHAKKYLESGYIRDYYRNVRELPDGRWSYEHKTHHLGSSVFTAQHWVHDESQTSDRALVTRSYISSFDENEPGFGLYFLAELPEGVHPQTVEDALEALKPPLVKNAERRGDEVLRQGDVFAIPTHLITKDLPRPSHNSAYVLGVNHMATEVRIDNDGAYFARGMLRHRPRESWRRPEHRRLTLGDRKTWYELVKNTVPEGRSWSIQGNVD